MSFIYNMADTWNAIGTTFTAIKMNVTDTASAAGSLLQDLQVGSVSKFSISKAGVVVAAGSITGATLASVAGITAGAGSTTALAALTLSPGANTAAVAATGYSITGANTQSLVDLAGTWNTSGAPTGLKLNITDTASDAASLLFDLQIASASKFKVDKTGIATGTSYVAATAGKFGFSTDVIITRAGAASLQLGAADAAAPVAQTLGVQNVVTGTSNTAGVNFTLAASQSTGSAAGGSILFKVSPAGGGGTSVNALATALTIDSTKLATFETTGYFKTSIELGDATANTLTASAGVLSIEGAALARLSVAANTFTKVQQTFNDEGGTTNASANMQIVIHRSANTKSQGIVFDNGSAANGGLFRPVGTDNMAIGFDAGAGLVAKATLVQSTGNLLLAAGLGVGNSANASVIPVANLVKKIEVFDAAGSSLGFIPVYSSIT